MFIIGFSGKKQSGKTTACHQVIKYAACCDEVGAWQLVSFADPLKELVYIVHFPPSAKGKLTMVEFIDQNKNTIVDGHAVRYWLQCWGTNVLRKYKPDIWLRYYRHEIYNIQQEDERLHSVSLILTADVRFPNEVECIHSLGGVVIRLTRAPYPNDQHESETALDDYKDFDYVLDNRDMNIEQQNEALLNMLIEKGWVERESK